MIFYNDQNLQFLADLFSVVSKRILQENNSMRLTAFFNLYKLCTFLHRSKLTMLAKNYV